MAGLGKEICDTTSGKEICDPASNWVECSMSYSYTRFHPACSYSNKAFGNAASDSDNIQQNNFDTKC